MVIAAIDNETVRAQGYPLPRFAVAQMIRALAAHNPQALAIDLLFLDPGNPEMDVELADALAFDQVGRRGHGGVRASAICQPAGPCKFNPANLQEFRSPPSIVWPIRCGP